MRTGRPRPRPWIVSGLLAALLTTASADALDIESYWEYGNPAASEARFRDLREKLRGDERLEVETQIARTFSLRREFARAHQVLDGVERELPTAGAAPRVRYLLERGRTFNSAGDPARARGLFERAWEDARAASLEGLAVDAAHMVAITWSGKPMAIEWNQRGLGLARPSKDGKARALIPAMLNNTAWDLHDMARYAEALPLFEEALAEWTQRARPAQIRFARYAVGRCLRLLNRGEEALAMQRKLLDDYAAAGESSGYVHEELAELLAAAGKNDEARPHFKQAAELLGKDPWLLKNDPQRLARLRERGG
jgi:tetratricopeptide (TPR) repeat protein